MSRKKKTMKVNTDGSSMEEVIEGLSGLLNGLRDSLRVDIEYLEAAEDSGDTVDLLGLATRLQDLVYEIEDNLVCE